MKEQYNINELSSFFCGQMMNAKDTVFTFDRHGKGHCRVILSGAEGEVAKTLKSYYEYAVNSTTD